MKILILEYVTGGGMRQESLPDGLAAEAELMLHALLRDLMDINGVTELVVLRDDRLPALRIAGDIRVVAVGVSTDFSACWQSHAAQCDAVWPIAPETAGILSGLCHSVEAGCRRLLNSSASAVSMASSKLETCRVLGTHGLPVVETCRLHEAVCPPGLAVIVKPDDGAGCDGMSYFADGLPDSLLLPADFLVQPWLSGESLSLSGVFCHGDALLLSVNRQIIDVTQTPIVLTACEVNIYDDRDGAWQHLLERVARAMPGLWGYAGIDLIMTATGPSILEVNPRLTSSYAGIRPATGVNPAEQVLKLLQTGKIAPFVCRTDEIWRVHLNKDKGPLL
ncbi:ATP-grasp domain-containing protein [Candidatus Methylospira mobilis]|uniref:ATP-grasp domain-containing protein n=1 Tax=Candidatus Methylospira mobilis TaxID=1808979 RepID=UPI0028E3BDD6|nr:ATP-grasp domain-containing protein [Candidatus Methylospira mobilis]WNV06239.1 ATP-grasp domain-containing protein [Candidatus Methylospira mobilis]